MYYNAVSSLILQLTGTIREAALAIDRSGRGIAMIADQGNKFLATVSDGDIRRAMLAGIGLDEPVTRILEMKAHNGSPPPVTGSIFATAPDLLEVMRRHKLRQIPLLDEHGVVRDLVILDDLVAPGDIRLQAVIMAGGFGRRLLPFTSNTPKPMLPVGDRPLLELLINQVRQAGIRHVNITTHYKPEIIVDHFGDGAAFGVDVTYVNEDQPLGTGGSLSLLGRSGDRLLVFNGDLLTRLNIPSMLAFHIEHEADMTAAVRKYEVQVPYGVVECKNSLIETLEEKPVIRAFVNAGIYLLEPAVLDYVPKNRVFNMTDLMWALLRDKKRVASFPMREEWIDIGHAADYERAQTLVKSGEWNVLA